MIAMVADGKLNRSKDQGEFQTSHNPAFFSLHSKVFQPRNSIKALHFFYFFTLARLTHVISRIWVLQILRFSLPFRVSFRFNTLSSFLC